jgi:hypothetical protein
MTISIQLPSDAEVEKYDLGKLEQEVKQHLANIATYERILVEEKTRLTVAENIVRRKKELIEEEKKKKMKDA